MPVLVQPPLQSFVFSLHRTSTKPTNVRDAAQHKRSQWRTVFGTLSANEDEKKLVLFTLRQTNLQRLHLRVASV